MPRRPNILMIVTDEERAAIERPRLLGWPTWHGDTDQPAAQASSAR